MDLRIHSKPSQVKASRKIKQTRTKLKNKATERAMEFLSICLLLSTNGVSRKRTGVSVIGSHLLLAPAPTPPAQVCSHPMESQIQSDILYKLIIQLATKQ